MNPAQDEKVFSAERITLTKAHFFPYNNQHFVIYILRCITYSTAVNCGSCGL